MRTTKIWSSLVPSALVAAFSSVFLGALFAAGSAGADPSSTPPADSKYIGAEKCKSCHGTAEIGDQYGHWKSMDHAKAFEALASDEAKKIGAEKGIADPQKADQCVKCHVTAFGVPEDQIKKGFTKEAGVQCETCHGPGEAHMKARMAHAMKGDSAGPPVIGEGEIVAVPTEKVCLECHNSESPTFKSFCFHEFSAKIRHLNPKKERATLDIGTCSCPICANGCPDEHKKLAEVKK